MWHLQLCQTTWKSSWSSLMCKVCWSWSLRNVSDCYKLWFSLIPRDLAEVKRKSILESRLNRNDEGKVSLVLHLVVLYNNSAWCIMCSLWTRPLVAGRLSIGDHPTTKGSGWWDNVTCDIRIAMHMPIFNYFVLRVLRDLSRKKRPRKVIVLQYCKFLPKICIKFHRDDEDSRVASPSNMRIASPSNSEVILLYQFTNILCSSIKFMITLILIVMIFLCECLSIYDWLTHFISQHIVILNNYAFSCLHWLMSTSLPFLSAFANHVNSWLVKWSQW